MSIQGGIKYITVSNKSLCMFVLGSCSQRSCTWPCLLHFRINDSQYSFRSLVQRTSFYVFSARCNIYISRLYYDVSVRLSVRLYMTEVHWRIIAILGFQISIPLYRAFRPPCCLRLPCCSPCCLQADHLAPC